MFIRRVSKQKLFIPDVLILDKALTSGAMYSTKLEHFRERQLMTLTFEPDLVLILPIGVFS